MLNEGFTFRDKNIKCKMCRNQRCIREYHITFYIWVQNFRILSLPTKKYDFMS